jgi:hypothetical protein
MPRGLRAICPKNAKQQANPEVRGTWPPLPENWRHADMNEAAAAADAFACG